jgi:hypothetical protein
MTEDETDAPRSDPFEEGYRAYVQAMKNFWANVDVDAVVSEARRQQTIMPMGTFFGPMGTFFACPIPFGTFGTYGCSVGPIEEE